MSTQLARVLIVEDHKPLREALARAMRTCSDEVLEAESVRSAEAKLERHPDLVLVDVWLPDGSGKAIIERAVRMRPAPTVIAMSGHATPEEAFELARAGARRYLAKPISREELMRSIDEALSDRPDLAPLLAAHVGRTPLREVVERVRDVMFGEALARSKGSRTAAARLLQLSRQAVQQAVREFGRGRGSGPDERGPT